MDKHPRDKEPAWSWMASGELTHAYIIAWPYPPII
jgi:hypothetical protein